MTTRRPETAAPTGQAIKSAILGQLGGLHCHSNSVIFSSVWSSYKIPGINIKFRTISRYNIVYYFSSYTLS